MFSDKLSQGIDALTDEWHIGGSQEDVANLEYVLHGKARYEEHIPQHVKEQFAKGKYHGGSFTEDDFDKGNDGKTIKDFWEHEYCKMAGLSLQEVVALRLYTTSSFVAINDPLRSQDVPHPFCMTVYHLSEGLKKLRAVRSEEEESFTTGMVLWRGVRNVTVDFEKFTGGAELAPMSTTPELRVAQSYAESRVPLLLKYNTRGMNTGCSIAFLSVFPKENEYLYPPLTTVVRDLYHDPGMEGSATVLTVNPTFA